MATGEQSALAAENDRLRKDLAEARAMIVGNAKAFNAETGYQQLLLSCKDEALGVFADISMWRRAPLYEYGPMEWVWNGASDFEDPVHFAAKERDRVFTDSSVGELTHTTPDAKRPEA